MEQTTFDQFLKLDIRAGTITSASAFPEARQPAFKLQVDFGPEVGILKSSAQITDLYSCEDLVGMGVMGVVNFPPRQVGPFMSECLILGFPDEKGRIVLSAPKSAVPNGSRLS